MDLKFSKILQWNKEIFKEHKEFNKSKIQEQLLIKYNIEALYVPRYESI